jgi:hypothetical protein
MQLNKGFDAEEEEEEAEAEEVCQEEAEMEDFLAGDEEPHDGIDLLSSSVEFEDSSSSSYHPPSPLLCDPQPPVIREPQKKRQKRVVATTTSAQEIKKEKCVSCQASCVQGRCFFSKMDMTEKK